jgi:outer membrane lipoprotein carrier protein
MSRRSIRAALAAFLLLWSGFPAAAADPQALLEGLRKTYGETSDLTARFVQTAHLMAAGMDRESTGEVAFKKPGKMRWTYEGDDPQLLVSDGKTLWIYQVRDRTVLRQDLSALPESSRLALDLLTGFQGVEKAFRVESCGEWCVALVPREARPDLSRVLVEVAPGGQEVRSVTTEDALGNRTTVEFLDLKRNQGIPDDTFTFQVPEGVQVVDMPGAP